MAKRVRWYSRNAPTQGRRFSLHGHGRDDEHIGGFVDRPSGSDDYLIVHYLTTVLVHCDGLLQEYPPHTVFVFTPGFRQAYGQKRTFWNHCWMHCEGDAVRGALAGSSIPCNRPICGMDPHISDRQVAAIEQEMLHQLNPDWIIIECQMRIWLQEIERCCSPVPQRQRPHPGVTRVLQLLAAQYARPTSLPSLARMAGLSVSRFSAAFQNQVGASPIRYLLHLRIDRSTELLRDRNLSVGEIAHRVGFIDPYYYSRQFSRIHGIGPMAWRQRQFLSGGLDRPPLLQSPRS